MSRARAVAAATLAYVNLLLMMFAGAAVLTACRLRWDMTLRAPVLAAIGADAVTAATVGLLASGGALFALAALSTAAGSVNVSARKWMLRIFAVGMVTMVVGEIVLAWRGVLWVRDMTSGGVADAAAAALRDLRALLRDLAAWGDLPRRLDRLIDEILSELPLLARLAGSAAATLLVLQLLAVTLAVYAASSAAADINAAGHMDYRRRGHTPKSHDYTPPLKSLLLHTRRRRHVIDMPPPSPSTMSRDS